MTNSLLKVSKLCDVNFCELPSNTNIENIDSDISKENKPALISVLNEYSESFTDGLPKKRVCTGEVNIRLTEPNLTVQRRPYRLSPDERQVVRGKIEELLDANIIRPSYSPFASPILLV